MIYFLKNLPAQLYDIIHIIELSQNSKFNKAYKDPYNGWRIVFDILFKNTNRLTNIEKYIEKQFDTYNEGLSYFEELCVEDNQQIIYLKDNSTF